MHRALRSSRAPAFRSKVLNLAKTCSMGLRSGGAIPQEHEARPDVADRTSHHLSLVGAQIVEDHDVARLQRRDEELFDIGVEALAVDGPIEQAGRVDAVVAQGGEESCGLPAAVRNLVDEALSLRRLAARVVDVGLRPGFIDEHQAPGIDEALIGSPSFAVAADVWAICSRATRVFF